MSSKHPPDLCPLSLKDLADVYEKLFCVRSKWYNLGLALSLSSEALDSIEIKYREDPSHCLREMLKARLQSDQKLTWRDIITALKRSIVGGSKLADEIEREHCSLEIERLSESKKLKLEQDFPGTQTCNLPQCVVRYNSYLKGKYKQSSILPDPDWPPPIAAEEHYINLALIETKRHDIPYTKTMAYDYVHGDIDNIVARKQEIKLENAFLPITDKECGERRLTILMDGAPGVGKTSISRKVCLDWANNKLLQEYHLVILVPLREVILTQNDPQSLADLLPADDPELKARIVQYLQENSGANVLFIFDGFDELGAHQRNVQSLFLDIIKGNRLPLSSVLVTSRPYASEPLRRMYKVNRHIEVLGFTKEQIENCIHQYLPQKEAQNLIRILEQRLDIGSICYIPLNCRIVLFVYKVQEFDLPHTLTELYEIFVLHTVKHHAEKISTDPAIIDQIKRASDIRNLPQTVQAQLDSLSEMAFLGINKDKLVFNSTEIKVSLNIQSIGLLNSIELFNRTGCLQLFHFLHLTIQEFLAARHIVSGGRFAEENALFDFMKSHINNKRFRMTLLFLAGLTHLRFIPPGESLLDYQSINLFDKDGQVMLLFLAQLLYESNNSSSQWLLSSLKSNTFIMSFSSLSPFDYLVLAHFFSSTPHDHIWGTIDLYNCEFKDKFHKIILQKDHSSKPGVPAVTLTEKLFVINNLTGPSCISLFRKLEKNICIQELDLHGNTEIIAKDHAVENSEQVGQTIEGMLRVNQSLRVLNLSNCDLDDIVIGHIAIGLTHNTTLQELDISENGSVTSDGWVQFFQAIQNETSLRQLDVGCNNLLSKGVIALTQMLLHNTTLVALTICGLFSFFNDDIPDDDGECWVQFFKGLQQHPLSKLDISDNMLGEDLTALGEFLQNASITVFKAADCNLTDDVCKAIAFNTSLIEIDISFLGATAYGWIQLFRGLQQHPTLSILRINRNFHFRDLERKVSVQVALGEFLKNSKTIAVLKAANSCLTDVVLRALASNLSCTNSSLRELDLWGNELLTCEGWIQFFQSLQQNLSLRKLEVFFSYEPEQTLNRGKVIKALSDMISLNSGIQELGIDKEFIEGDHKLLVKSLTQNTTLRLLGVWPDPTEIKKEIERLETAEGISIPNLKVIDCGQHLPGQDDHHVL